MMRGETTDLAMSAGRSGMTFAKPFSDAAEYTGKLHPKWSPIAWAELKQLIMNWANVVAADLMARRAVA